MGLIRGRVDRALERIVADGGVVERDGLNVISIDFGPDDATRHLSDLPPIDSLRVIKLNRAPRTQLWSVRKFKALNSVDLRDVDIPIGAIRASIPIDAKITLWRDQLDSAEQTALKQLGLYD